MALVERTYQRTVHNITQRIPEKIAASTSVRKPNAMRVNPTRRTSAGALKMQSKRKWRALSNGSTKRRRDDLTKGSSIEIFLAKIVCGRYIAFTCFIRCFDVQIALTRREDSSKARHPFDCRR